MSIQINSEISSQLKTKSGTDIKNEKKAISKNAVKKEHKAALGDSYDLKLSKEAGINKSTPASHEDNLSPEKIEAYKKLIAENKAAALGIATPGLSQRSLKLIQ